jgi:hypothetical protein
MERESDQARPDGTAKPERGADGIYRSLQQADERSNVDSEPQSAAPYAEAAEAGAATSGENITEGSRGGEATQRS